MQSSATEVKSPKPKREIFGYSSEYFDHPHVPEDHYSNHQETYDTPTYPHYHSHSTRLNTNVFGYDDDSFNQIFNRLNGINQISYYGAPIPTPQPLFGSAYDYLNYGTPVIDNNHINDNTYISHDGRILKQYSVNEKHHDDVPPQNHDNIPPVPPQHQDARVFTPTFFTNYNPAYNTDYNTPLQIPYYPHNLATTNQLEPNVQRQPPSFLAKNHGQIALGSGSLGYITSPTGRVVLGSGSLGYLSHKQHSDMISEIVARKQKILNSGPTSFGHDN